MNSEQIIFDGLSFLQVSMKPEDLIAVLKDRGLKLSIHSTSQNRIITYYFGNEDAREEAVRRWRKHGIEIIGYKEKEIMSLDDAIGESADYFSTRITALQSEDKDMTERYDRMPDWAVKRQREIEMEVKRLSLIQKIFMDHLIKKVDDDTGRKIKAAP